MHVILWMPPSCLRETTKAREGVLVHPTILIQQSPVQPDLIVMPFNDIAIYSRTQATGVLASSLFVGNLLRGDVTLTTH